MTALPEDDVDALLVSAGKVPFIGWATLHAAAEKAWARDRTKFKEVFRAETGMEVDRLLHALSSSDRRGRSPQLVGVLAAMLHHLRDPKDATAAGLHVLKRLT